MKIFEYALFELYIRSNVGIGTRKCGIYGRNKQYNGTI